MSTLALAKPLPTLSLSRAFTCKPWPESGRDCFTCATFARQRKLAGRLASGPKGRWVRTGSWTGPPREKRAPRVGISSTVFGVRPMRAGAPCAFTACGFGFGVLGFGFGFGVWVSGLGFRVWGWSVGFGFGVWGLGWMSEG